MSKETRKQELRDNQIKLETAENKKRNQQRMEKQKSEIEAIEKGYDVTSNPTKLLNNTMMDY
jgi:hypothetical protein